MSANTDDNFTVTEPADVLHCISKKFESVYAASCIHCSSPVEAAPVFDNTTVTDGLLCSAMSFSSMLSYLQKLPNKAGGPHLIDYRLLRASARAIAGDCQRYGYSIIEQSLPKCTKISYITPVSKKDGGARPLAISDPITKISFEKPLAAALVNVCEKYDLLPKHQYGFRSRRSTADNLLTLQELVMSASLQKAAGVIICFFDVEKAFDQVSHSEILNEFRRHHSGGKLYSAANDYLRNRHALVNNYGCIGNLFPVLSGSPQGGVPSPIIYNIAVASSHTDVENAFGYPILSYADDDAMVGVVYDQFDVQRFNLATAALATNLKTRLNLNLNALKSHLIYISLNKQINLDIKVMLNGQPLKEVSLHQHLGVLFDTKLRFTNHVSSRLARTTGHVTYVIHKLTSLPSICPGAITQSMQSLRIQLYRSLFLSNLGYAMGSWRFKKRW